MKLLKMEKSMLKALLKISDMIATIARATLVGILLRRLALFSRVLKLSVSEYVSAKGYLKNHLFKS